MATAQKNSEPYCSIIIPAYNAENTLRACLNRVGNQSIPRYTYEILVIDDGSTDQTFEIIKNFNKVRYFYQTNQGPAAARNAGVRIARGELILFTDADCEPDYYWIEEMVKPFGNQEVVAVKGAYRTRQKQLTARFAQREFEDRYDLLSRADSIDMIDTYAAAFKKGVFLKIGGFDPSFPVANNEDTELSYRLVTAGYRMVFNPYARVYHTHPETLWCYLCVKFWRGYWRMIVYRRYPKKAIKDSYTPVIIKVQTLMMALSFMMVPLAVVQSIWVRPVLGLWFGIFLSTLPFSYKAFRKDRMIGLLTPFIVFFRSVAFASGSLLGVIRSIRLSLHQIV